MVKWLESRVLWGSLLILAGVVFLLQNIFHIDIGAFFWAVLLAMAGAVFITVFISNRQLWWALIPGFTLLGVSATVFISNYLPRLEGVLGGFFVLGGIGLAFVVIYLNDRRFWWALIPAGVLFTVAIISVVEGLFGGLETGGIFFIGLGLTFAAVAIFPAPQGKMRWAWYPAAVLTVMGLLIAAAAENLINYVWPVALILGGLVLIYRNIASR